MNSKEHEINLCVSGKLRQRRKQLGITQEKVANHLGITFQQVQKMECGANRISSGRLLLLANYLKIPFIYFFEDEIDSPTFPSVEEDQLLQQYRTLSKKQKVYFSATLDMLSNQDKK